MFLSYEMMIPSLYLGRAGIALATDADRTSYLISAMQFFGGLATALSTLYQNSYVGVTKLAGMCLRLEALVQELDRRGGHGGPDEEARAILKAALLHPGHSGALAERVVGGGSGRSIVCERVDVFSPAGKLLVKDLDLTIAPGEHLMIEVCASNTLACVRLRGASTNLARAAEGPNGAGKSSLLRVLGRLWPLCGGRMVQARGGPALLTIYWKRLLSEFFNSKILLLKRVAHRVAQCQIAPQRIHRVGFATLVMSRARHRFATG
jgi:ABC-type multidrug transport system fused ATPase/permease subunit